MKDVLTSQATKEAAFDSEKSKTAFKRSLISRAAIGLTLTATLGTIPHASFAQKENGKSTQANAGLIEHYSKNIEEVVVPHRSLVGKSSVADTPATPHISEIRSALSKAEKNKGNFSYIGVTETQSSQTLRFEIGVVKKGGNKYDVGKENASGKVTLAHETYTKTKTIDGTTIYQLTAKTGKAPITLGFGKQTTVSFVANEGTIQTVANDTLSSNKAVDQLSSGAVLVNAIDNATPTPEATPTATPESVTLVPGTDRVPTQNFCTIPDSMVNKPNLPLSDLVNQVKAGKVFVANQDRFTNEPTLGYATTQSQNNQEQDVLENGIFLGFTKDAQGNVSEVELIEDASCRELTTSKYLGQESDPIIYFDENGTRQIISVADLEQKLSGKQYHAIQTEQLLPAGIDAYKAITDPNIRKMVVTSASHMGVNQAEADLDKSLIMKAFTDPSLNRPNGIYNQMPTDPSQEPYALVVAEKPTA